MLYYPFSDVLIDNELIKCNIKVYTYSDRDHYNMTTKANLYGQRSLNLEYDVDHFLPDRCILTYSDEDLGISDYHILLDSKFIYYDKGMNDTGINLILSTLNSNIATSMDMSPVIRSIVSINNANTELIYFLHEIKNKGGHIINIYINKSDIMYNEELMQILEGYNSCEYFYESELEHKYPARSIEYFGRYRLIKCIRNRIYDRFELTLADMKADTNPPIRSNNVFKVFQSNKVELFTKLTELYLNKF